MSSKMLIDASHPEETRVVVVRGNRVEEFDFESASKRQLRGNIYLAKVMRVEPSLQAAFVDYGGNRHGFLAFSEIHPDYYQIPVADRQALIEEELRAEGEEEEDVARPQRRSRRYRRSDYAEQRADKRREADPALTEAALEEGTPGLEEIVRPDSQPEVAEESSSSGEAGAEEYSPQLPAEQEAGLVQAEASEPSSGEALEPGDEIAAVAPDEPTAEPAIDLPLDQPLSAEAEPSATNIGGDNGQKSQTDWAQNGRSAGDGEANGEGDEEGAEIEQLGGDAMEEVPVRPLRPRRQYKIQEVIKRRQVLLVQVVKEERGNKGAALTTYLSLAGRYSVLMPNTARGGGISRKITDPADRRRLKSIAQELDVPDGMGVIVRTAGASRTKAELKRDFEYLMRMWETVRETTLRSSAPTLVYEEGSLIKRSIRDLYNKDIAEITVAGEDGYREAKEFMRLLMPSHAKMVQPYRERSPMFAKFGVETQLDAMFSNQVTLKSGGYIVINQAEALVAIDVNSGRSTREHNIEDTALRTNLEAADEISRQLRLRDLAGLIVIDFIDMEESRNNRTVERRLKDALKNDRARIQIGRMSHFGLLEMSRQRMRAGVIEGSTVACPHCGGAGTVRSTASIALHVLRALEDALIKNSEYDLIVKTRTPVALYILNQKRSHLRDLENQFGVSLTIGADDGLTNTTYYTFQRGEPAAGAKEPPPAIQPETASAAPAEESLPAIGETEAEPGASVDEAEAAVTNEPKESESEANFRQRRRRRRRRGRGSDREVSGIAASAPQPPDDALEAMVKFSELAPLAAHPAEVAAAPETAFAKGESEISEEANGGSNAARIADVGDEADAASTVLIQIESEPDAPASSGDLPIGENDAGGEKRQRRSRVPRGGRGAIGRKGAAALPAGPDSQVHKQDEPRDIAGPIRVEAEKAAAEPPGSDNFGPPGGRFPEEADEARPQKQEASKPSEDPPLPKRSGWWQRARAGWRG
jgi:ribonuclease E